MTASASVRWEHVEKVAARMLGLAEVNEEAQRLADEWVRRWRRYTKVANKPPRLRPLVRGGSWTVDVADFERWWAAGIVSPQAAERRCEAVRMTRRGRPAKTR